MGVEWNNLAQDRKVTGCYEQSDELPYSTMRAKFFWLTEEVLYKFLKRDCVAPIFASCENLRPLCDTLMLMSQEWTLIGLQ